MAQAIERLPDDPNELKAMLLAERARNERLVQIIKEMQRHRFGRRAETLPEDQMLLALEEVEQTEAGAAAAAEAKSAAEREKAARKRRTNRGALPAHLPRIETIVDIDEKACPCCKGALHRIGEDVSERLDIVPAQFRVLVTRRPKYACRACEGAVVQAPAPARLIEGGLPTEATVAHVLVSKYADHLPLYRQAQIYARQGIALDRSTLADWVGRAAWHLRPVHERLLEHIRSSTKIFADETKAPVLDPGRGRTKTGQLWAYARDDRPFGGADPPIAVYVYAQNRKSEQPLMHLAGFTGVVQVDGYAGYRALAQKNSVSLAFCWSHLWMPPLLQGLILRFGESSRLLSSIRPVMTTRPAPSALMVNPQAKTQSRATSSRLDATSGFGWLRFARFRHHTLKNSSHPRRPLDQPVSEYLRSITPLASAPLRKRRRAAKAPIRYALFCWRARRRQHSPVDDRATEPATSMSDRASASRIDRHG